MKRIKEYVKKVWGIVRKGDWLKDPVFWARFAAYAIPLAFLLYVLYMNFLPFGYNKTFIINVGSKGDIDSSKEFYLEPSRNLSDATTSPDGSSYRTLNGVAYADFNPKEVLKNAKVTVSVEGDGISIIPPVIDFDPNSIDWDYSWDFTKGIPRDFTGNAFMFDGEATFNGRDTRLELPNSANKFEEGAFSTYVEWKPTDPNNDTQQIIGHFNWEIWQNKNNVSFQVGRMNNAQGQIYSIKYPITSDFFNKKHSALAIYNPSKNGYIDFYVDGIFAGRTYIGSGKVWTGYGNENLSLGWTPYNYRKSPHFSGVIYKVNTIFENIFHSQTETIFKFIDGDPSYISFISNSTSTIKQIQINVVQK